MRPSVREAATTSLVVLDAVRSSRRNGYDRVVFEFRGDEAPGHEIRYMELPIEHCASGQQLDVGGQAFLHVSMSPAVGYVDRDGEREQTIDDRDRQPGLPRVQHLKETCDHHGGVGWVIGLRQQRPYRVLELSNPTRLVVDIRHD